MFCPNCGVQNTDEARFCVSCGTALNGAGAPAQTQPVSGMRTEEELLDFLRDTFGYTEKKLKPIRPGIPQILRALMPNEGIEFIFDGMQNMNLSLRATDTGASCVYALTNKRFMIAHPENATNALRGINLAMKGRKILRGVENYTYDQIGGVTYTKGLMYGTIAVSFFDGEGTVSVDKKYTEIVYNAINEALYTHRKMGAF